MLAARTMEGQRPALRASMTPRLSLVTFIHPAKLSVGDTPRPATAPRAIIKKMCYIFLWIIFQVVPGGAGIGIDLFAPVIYGRKRQHAPAATVALGPCTHGTKH